ncbi:molybdopterin-binding protein [Clostridium luticellarii]|uniref:molybdopterin-binding protein n=1 Tax=Clostridium luticellarii TaxID=1691940 RepID=UPI000D026C0A|nr:molybdopterin-binding protein [Clostridium luticellarii]MCI1944776.1 molybdopterin-binding protein [Clostridium luticellarii]MCI1968271.1 molybdopterin-binding protein [Clostridium luticellarii]
MINSVVIIPTGNEVLSGVVTDTNSPAIMQLILEKYPGCEIKRVRPVSDNEDKIVEQLKKCIDENVDLVIFIGGSGGGHRYVSTLARDFTHSAIERCISEYKYKEIYGKNGHMWSKLVAARQGGTLVVNVPGPYVEAVEAARACIGCLTENEEELDVIVDRISSAVLSKYPKN